jgi:hypothetical protein
LIFFAFLLSFFIPSARLKLPVNNEFQSDVETIIKDYPNSFQQYTSDDFETAKSSFHNFYDQLNNLTIHFEGKRSFHLQGVYESPSEEKKGKTMNLAK